MAENMGKVIRKLRKERGLTQEELAEQIGVTSQAISKWENNTGLPDISQVVPLANFFGVSIDILFDYCSADKKRNLEEYQKRSAELRRDGLVSGSVELWRDAVGKYPGDYGCMYQLANALFAQKTSTGDPDAEKNAKEGIALCEKILSGCTDPGIRAYTVQLLTYWYSMPWLSVADEQKAVSYAKMGGTLWASSEILLESAYFTEEGKKEARKIRDGNILSFMDHICLNIAWRIEPDAENELRNCRTALILWQTLIPDGNFLFYHCRIADLYLRMAKCHARMSRKEETLEALHLAAYHAKKKDAIPEGEQQYTSPFVSFAVSDAAESSKNYSETEYELFISSLNDPCFGFIRHEPEFIALSK